MDVAHPIRVAIPTLEGPVLEVLARTTRPLTGLEVHRLARSGSPSGVRLALARLTHQGLVHAEERAAAVFYVGNRDHLAWPAVDLLTGLRRALLDKLRAEFRRWRVTPVHASVFGSAARGDGDADSDIDILVIRPEGVGEDEAPWSEQVDRLRDRVHVWSGNNCQAFQLDVSELMAHVQAQDPLVEDWLRDGITVAGPDLRTILHRAPAPGGE